MELPGPLSFDDTMDLANKKARIQKATENYINKNGSENRKLKREAKWLKRKQKRD